MDAEVLGLVEEVREAFFECRASRAASWRRAREGATVRGGGRGMGMGAEGEIEDEGSEGWRVDGSDEMRLA